MLNEPGPSAVSAATDAAVSVIASAAHAALNASRSKTAIAVHSAERALDNIRKLRASGAPYANCVVRIPSVMKISLAQLTVVV